MKKLYLTTAAILAIIPAAFATSDVEPVAVIKGPNGPVRISLSQYNPAQHDLHVADEHHDEHGVSRSHQPQSISVSGAVTAQSTTPIAAVPLAPIVRQFGVLQNRGKFYIVDPMKQGEVVTDIPAFDVKGYPDNASAWAVITAAALAPPLADNGGAAV